MKKPLAPGLAATPDDLPPSYLPLSKVFAVGLGNALEFYDFLSFSFFSIQIGRCFFPAQQTSHGLLFTLATFGAGFFTRPLGGMIIGAYADRVGRKPAMMVSFTLMGVAITGLALTPSYASIGVAAPILLLLFRLLQGFALGGEVGPSTAFLIEAAPPARRGLYVGLQYATQDVAVLAAGLVGFALSSWLTPAALDAWGWRAAFLLGAAIVPLGLLLRRGLPETLHAAEAPAGARPKRRAPWGLLGLGLMMLAATGISNYVLDYITTYAQDSLRLSSQLAFGATAALGLSSITGDILSGLLSDRVGRKPVMLTAVALLIALTVPTYMAMIHWPSAPMVYAATVFLAAVIAFMVGPALITISETLPRASRAGTLGALYAVAMATFGGSTQFIIKALIDITGSPLAPAWYMTGAAAIGALAMVIVRESSPVKRR
jgi:MHS family citrate/tricarballylate:H+ symporter-like MFS transporter